MKYIIYGVLFISVPCMALDYKSFSNDKGVISPVLLDNAVRDTVEKVNDIDNKKVPYSVFSASMAVLLDNTSAQYNYVPYSVFSASMAVLLDNTSAQYNYAPLAGNRDFAGVTGFTGQPCVRAYMGSDQTNPLCNGTWVKAVLNTQSFEVGGDAWNTTAQLFTAIYAGYYHIQGQVIWYNCIDNTTYRAAIGNGDASTIYAQTLIPYETATISYLTCQIENVQYLSAGDVVGLWVLHNEAGQSSDILSGASNSFITIRKVQ